MTVSMVISTYNRGELLDHSLRRLTELTLPDELLIIDDGGDDNTPEVCRRWADHLPIRYLYNHNPGPSICSMARNIGIKHATGELFVTSEPELIFHNDVIARFLNAHEYFPNDVISTGHVWFAGPDHHDATIPDGVVEEAIGWVAPYAALYGREWLEEIGGWDEEFPGHWGWDDTDLLTRLRIKGHGQHIDLGCKAIHQYHGLGEDAGGANEAHFMAKSFKRGPEDPNQPDIIANRGHEWGKIKPRD